MLAVNYFKRLSEAAEHLQYIKKQSYGQFRARAYLKQIGFSPKEAGGISETGRKKKIL